MKCERFFNAKILTHCNNTLQHYKKYNYKYNYNTMNYNEPFYQGSYGFPQGSMAAAGPGGPGGASTELREPLKPGLLAALSTAGYSDEPPLLEELGIHFDHIAAKTRLVLAPGRGGAAVAPEVLQDADLAGPVLFFMAFGLCLLAAGRVHFGYIYGVALFGTVSLHWLARLMCREVPGSPNAPGSPPVHFFTTSSILGYSFLPLCFLTAAGTVVSLDNTAGYAAGAGAVAWATWAASGLLNRLLRLHGARALIAYPLLIFYSVFALMAVFV